MKRRLAEDISRTALDMVGMARQRRIEAGHGYDEDDGQGAEELAVASALFLTPADMDIDIAWAEDNQLRHGQLIEYYGERTFTVFRKDGPLLDAGEVTEYGSFDQRLDDRIEVLVEGLAMGLAELERLMRIREGRDRDDDLAQG